MNTVVYEWLSKHFECKRGTMIEALKDEKATAFLLVWPIFEQKCFDGYMTKDKIPGFACRHQTYYDPQKCDESTLHFHQRYQDQTLYKNLIHKTQNDFQSFKCAIGTDYSALTDEQKLTILLFVSFRYRNNIFHGNKGIRSWSQYPEQIEKCLHFMMQVIDCVKAQDTDGGKTA